MPGVVSRSAIETRAYHLFLERGREHGHDLDDWLLAEHEVLARLGRRDTGGLSPLDGVLDSSRTLLPQSVSVPYVTRETLTVDPRVPTLATRDHAVIRRWAAQRQAEPATGERTSTGPATVTVTDGGTGLRLNFPGNARFRQITWAEWLKHLDEAELAFVYENDAAFPMLSHRYRLVRVTDLERELSGSERREDASPT
jgi:hypothetical protein